MHASENCAEFFRVGFVSRLDGALIFWSRIFDEVEALFETLFVEGVACAHVFHLHCSTDVAGTEFVNRSFDLTANGIDLRESLLGVSVGIGEVGASLKHTLHNLEVGNFADVRFNGGFEHEQANRSIVDRINFFAVGVANSRHVVNKRNHVAKEFHHAANAHVLECAHTEYRIY